MGRTGIYDVLNNETQTDVDYESQALQSDTVVNDYKNSNVQTVVESVIQDKVEHCDNTSQLETYVKHDICQTLTDIIDNENSYEMEHKELKCGFVTRSENIVIQTSSRTIDEIIHTGCSSEYTGVSCSYQTELKFNDNAVQHYTNAIDDVYQNITETLDNVIQRDTIYERNVHQIEISSIVESGNFYSVICADMITNVCGSEQVDCVHQTDTSSIVEDGTFFSMSCQDVSVHALTNVDSHILQVSSKYIDIDTSSELDLLDIVEQNCGENSEYICQFTKRLC